MAILTNNKKPQLLKDIETDFGSTIAKAIYKRAAQFHIWANDSLPLGMVIPFYGSQEKIDFTDVDQPNSDYWQFCNGSAITNADSPLLGGTLPDFTGKFLKGSLTEGIIGGQTNINIAHDHGGITNIYNPIVVSSVGSTGVAHVLQVPHFHTIPSDWSTLDVTPRYADVQFYMKVNGGPGFSGPTLDSSFGEFINTDNVKFGELYSTEFAELLRTNINSLDLIIPIGQIVPIITGIAGTPTPNSNIFQLCDGSLINNVNSPLKGINSNTFTPNLVDRYIKIPTTFGLSGTLAGNNTTTALNHTHTVKTLTGTTTEFATLSADGLGAGATRDAKYPTRHIHSINNSFPAAINREPPFYTVKFYMRIQ